MGYESEDHVSHSPFGIFSGDRQDHSEYYWNILAPQLSLKPSLNSKTAIRTHCPIQREPFVGSSNLVLFDDGDFIMVSTETEAVRFLLLSGKPIGEPIAWICVRAWFVFGRIENRYNDRQNSQAPGTLSIRGT